MKPQEYVNKYRLDLSDRFNHNEFIRDLSSDFISLLEFNKAEDNIKGFDNALRCIRSKFDAINNKTKGIIKESLWKYFFATVVCKLRDKLCAREVQIRQKQREEKRKEWQARNDMRKEYERQEREMFDEFYSNLFNSILKPRKIIPKDSYEILGLSLTASRDEVKKAYWELSHEHHPDKGGKQENFVRISQAKNEVLSYLT